MIDWTIVGTDLGKLGLAYFLALAIGWERETSEHSAGIRTFPLVAMASCGYVLIAGQLAPDASTRVMQGIITGIGFIGGGAILRHGNVVSGTATAASIWNTGALGIAVANGRYDIAIILSALNLITLRLLEPLKERLQKRNDEAKNRGHFPGPR